MLLLLLLLLLALLLLLLPHQLLLLLLLLALLLLLLTDLLLLLTSLCGVRGTTWQGGQGLPLGARQRLTRLLLELRGCLAGQGGSRLLNCGRLPLY